MKVVCVDNIYYIDNKRIILPITIGKEYNIYSDDPFSDYYIITDDEYDIHIHPKHCFMTKEEYRNRRLEEIGI